MSDPTSVEALSHMRYSTEAFPPYRFRPGKHPHPTAHPDGHSYHAPGAPEPDVTYYTPEDWRDSPDYRYGCDLYNHAYWWEAHEAWEGLWQLTDKKDYQGQFLQTLIQVGACHLKLEQQKIDGIRSLRLSSRGHLDQTLERAPGGVIVDGIKGIMGVDIAAWYARVDAYYEARLRVEPLGHDVRTYPYIDLPL